MTCCEVVGGVGGLLELVATGLLLKDFYCIFIFHFQLEGDGGEGGRREEERGKEGGREGGGRGGCIVSSEINVISGVLTSKSTQTWHLGHLKGRGSRKT